MKQRYLLVAVAVATVLMSTARASSAQTTSAGPYYATPSWDQKLACDSAANCPRFVVLANWNNDAVLDRETGLVWERSPLAPCVSVFCVRLDSGRRTWFQAETRCNEELTTGGRGGWRLTTPPQLGSLVDYRVAPATVRLPLGHTFVAVQQDLYWSSTTSTTALATPGDVSLSVEMFSGAVFGDSKSHNGDFVWCVRGGSGAAVQRGGPTSRTDDWPGSPP